QTLTTGPGTKALQEAGTQLVSNSQAVSTTLTSTGQNLVSLSWKFVGLKASEAVAREALNSGVQMLANYSFELLKPDIGKKVQSSVRTSFSNPHLLNLLRKMHAIDLTTKSAQLKSRVDMIVSETISPRHDFMRKQWDSIGLPLIKGVLSDSSRYGSAASMAI